MSWSAIAAQVAAAAPVDRDEARRAADRELSKGVYHQNEPGPIDRALNSVFDWISRSAAGPARGSRWSSCPES